MKDKTLWLCCLTVLIASVLDTQPITAADPPGSNDPCSFCSAGSEPSSGTVVIDARSGDYQGERRFAKREKVKVIVTNKNPYLFQYKLIKTENAVKETALSGFVGLLSPFIQSQLPTEKPATANAQAASRPFTQVDSKCPQLASAQALVNQIVDLVQEIRTTVQDVDTLRDANDAAADVLKTVEDERSGLKSQNADCHSLCSLTNVIAGNQDFMSFPPKDPSLVGRQVDALPTKLARMRSLVTLYESSFKAPSCRLPKLNEFLAEGERAVEHSESLRADVTKSLDLAARIKVWQNTIKTVRADPKAFEEQLQIGDYDQTTDVTLKLTRQSLDKPGNATELSSTVLRFGRGPFFSVSGGLGYADIPKPQFKPVQGFERTRSGDLVQPEVSTRVIGESETAARVTPLLLLNGRLWQWDPVSVHLSLGITAKNDDKGTDIEYLVGPSISALDDQLFFTVGLYGGRQQALQGDLYVGQKIDQSVTELPVGKRFLWKTGFALSYKIK